MRKLTTFAVVLMVVAGLAYSLGRKHSSADRDVQPPPAESPGEALVPLSRAGTASTAALPPPNTAAVRPSADNLDRTAPFAQKMLNARAGYEAATLDVADALRQIETLPASERSGFTTGVFSFIARHRTPAEALALYGQQGDKVRGDALRALVSEWISTRSSRDEETRSALRDRVQTASNGRLGLEVELAMTIAASAPDDELATAWLNAFSTHPGRSEMLPMLGGKLIRENADTLLERTAGWTDWERERAVRAVLGDWASRSPQEAWSWFQGQRERLGQELSASILEPWAGSDPEAVQALLNSLSDPAQRRTAVESIGKALALRSTAQAVAWAEALPDPEEQQAAQRSIYEATPRGIGAAIGLENGFPTLRSILPGSPLEGTGIRPGDQFVEVRPAEGSPQSLYGVPLESVVRLIRGEPGSALELRLLRRDPGSGQIEELLVPLRRAQLYFDESSSPGRR